MRFFVDGYNVTKRDPATSSLTLAEQREALVARLAARGRDLLGRGEITVVFDGVSGGGSEVRRGPVVVRYARDEVADDLIARTVCAGDVVVTSDGELAARARAAGARVIPAEHCFEERKLKRRSGRHPVAGGLPPGANKVTEELKKIWLDDEE